MTSIPSKLYCSQAHTNATEVKKLSSFIKLDIEEVHGTLQTQSRLAYCCTYVRDEMQHPEFSYTFVSKISFLLNFKILIYLKNFSFIKKVFKVYLKKLSF